MVSMPPSIRAVVPGHEPGTSGPLALTEESTVTTKCWPGDIRSVPGRKPGPSRTAKMTGAAETGAGDLLRPGEDGPAGAVADDGVLAGPLCWVALPQAHSAPVSASPVSAALTAVRFSMTAPAGRGRLMPLGRGISRAWFPFGCRPAAGSTVPADTHALPGGPGWAGRSAGGRPRQQMSTWPA